ncbi:MAG: hypothetical protein ACREDN_11230 [Aestuariivirga sp.]
MHLGGAVVFCPVQGDRQVATEAAERLQAITRFEPTHRFVEHTMEDRGRHLVEHGADMIVAEDFPHLEQRPAVRCALPFEQPALIGEKRGALHEEDRERRHANVGHGVMTVAAVALVRRRSKDATQHCDRRFELLHAMVESISRSSRNKNLAN